MMIEDKLTGLMHERADRPVDADALLAGALAAGRARKRRRQAAYAVASAGVAGAVAATLLVNTGGGGSAVVTGGGTGHGAATWDSVPALPAVAGEPGAAARPDLVGSDPTVLRFTVPWAPLPVQAVSWSSHDGVEQIDVSMVSGDASVTGRVALWRGPDRGEADNASVPNTTTPVVVEGHPAVLSQEQFDWGPNQWITWQPAEGLTAEAWLVASGSNAAASPSIQPVVGVDDLKEFAAAVRFDTTTACSAPLRLPVVPTGGRLVNCSGTAAIFGAETVFRNGELLVSSGSRLFEIDYRTPMEVQAETEPSETGSPDSIPTVTATPTPTAGPGSGSQPPTPTGAEATEDSGRLSSTERVSIRFLRPGLGAWVVYQPGGEEEASAIQAGLAAAGEPDDPATWPRRPIG